MHKWNTLLSYLPFPLSSFLYDYFTKRELFVKRNRSSLNVQVQHQQFTYLYVLPPASNSQHGVFKFNRCNGHLLQGCGSLQQRMALSCSHCTLVCCSIQPAVTRLGLVVSPSICQSFGRDACCVKV